jgi:hypothetical protein
MMWGPQTADVEKILLLIRNATEAQHQAIRNAEITLQANMDQAYQRVFQLMKNTTRHAPAERLVQSYFGRNAFPIRAALVAVYMRDYVELAIRFTKGDYFILTYPVASAFGYAPRHGVAP